VQDETTQAHDIELLALHGLAVKKAGSAAAVADILGREEAEVAGALDEAAGAGRAMAAKGMYMVTPAGRSWLDEQYPVAFARFRDQGVGWGVVDPGHGVVLARADGDPAMAAAAAPLSASGTYGPLLLTAGAGDLGAPLESFLRDIRPGYTDDPVRGVYNHGWLVGDAKILTPGLQARLDSLLEIMPVSQEEDTTP